MATVRKRGPGRFQVRWWDGAAQRSRTFATHRDAQAFRATVEVEQARGDWLDPRQSREPLSVVAGRWLETQRSLAPTTLANIEGRLRTHLLPALGDRRLSSVQPSDVEAWVATLIVKGLSPSWVRKCYQDLDQIMRMAVRDRLLRQSPCVGIKLPAEVHDREMHFLTHDEVRALAEAIAPRYAALIYTAAYTGMRAGELAALRKDRIDFLGRRIHVIASVSEVKGGLVTGPTKTKSRRWVKVPRFLCDMLSMHVTRFPSRDGYVFTSATGRPLRHRNFYRRDFRAAVVAADLPVGLRFHDLRHSCAAILIQEGWTLEQVKRHLGHSTIRVTSDRYAHLYAGHDDELLDRLDARVRALPPRNPGPREVTPLPGQPLPPLQRARSR